MVLVCLDGTLVPSKAGSWRQRARNEAVVAVLARRPLEPDLGKAKGRGRGRQPPTQGWLLSLTCSHSVSGDTAASASSSLCDISTLPVSTLAEHL